MNSKFSEDEKRQILRSCTRWLSGHVPRKPKEQFQALADSTGADETSDFYGRGALIEEFEKEIATQLGKPAAIFLPSGTMAQLIALRIWCDQKSNRHIAMHETSHLALYEQEAYKHLHQMRATFLGEKSRALSHQDFSHSKPDYAAALIELPQRELGGVLPDWNDLVAMTDFCRSRGIAVHLDGARLWECTPSYNKSLAEIATLFDSVYVSFYKGLGGMTGAVLTGSVDFIAEARVWQRRYGGNLYRLTPYVISAREALKDRLPKMQSYFDKAREIAAALSPLPGVHVEPAVPQTNMMHIYFDHSAHRMSDAFLTASRDTKMVGLTYFESLSDGSCKGELTVGDATLALTTPEIVEFFKAVVASTS